MGLSSKYTLAHGRIPDLFGKIRDGQAPDQLSTQLLKDWGFTSSNDRAFIPMLKELGFLSSDGKPTQRYHDYRDHSRSKAIMAQAIREAYSDIFLIKEHPVESDKETVQGKFKSFHNVSENVASLMMKNFYALLKLSDLKATTAKPMKEEKAKKDTGSETKTETRTPAMELPGGFQSPGLHYNIQIHLPATKDVEVYNAIFKSLREHLLEE